MYTRKANHIKAKLNIHSILPNASWVYMHAPRHATRIHTIPTFPFPSLPSRPIFKYPVRTNKPCLQCHATLCCVQFSKSHKIQVCYCTFVSKSYAVVHPSIHPCMNIQNIKHIIKVLRPRSYSYCARELPVQESSIKIVNSVSRQATGYNCLTTEPLRAATPISSSQTSYAGP